MIRRPPTVIGLRQSDLVDLKQELAKKNPKPAAEGASAEPAKTGAGGQTGAASTQAGTAGASRGTASGSAPGRTRDQRIGV